MRDAHVTRRGFLSGVAASAATAILAACGGSTATDTPAARASTAAASATGVAPTTAATSAIAPGRPAATGRSVTAPPGAADATSIAASTYVAGSLATMNANARPTSGGVDPCALVTQAEAAATIGAPVAAPTQVSSFGGGPTEGEMESLCVYGDILSFTSPRITITVGQKDPAHADKWSAARYWAREKENHPEFLEPVPGVGDEAMKRASATDRAIVYVLKKDVVFDIDVQMTPAPLNDALGLAMKAVARLP